MDFLRFCQSHGLIIDFLPKIGVWTRYKTVDKPKHKNGSVKFLGDAGFCQNHATMSEPTIWLHDRNSDIKIDHAAINKSRAIADGQLRDGREKAAKKTVQIISESKFEQHAYLDSKGFPDMQGLVYMKNENNLLVIPMRVGKSVVGCQLIDRDGIKKFLFGQRCAGAEFRIGSGGLDIYCEGYCTGLSINAAMSVLRVPCAIHICFSAGNMQRMAAAAKRGVIFADNDISQTGEKAAIATGLPYFMPETQGQDFNDMWQEIGTFRTSQLMRKFLRELN